MSGDTEKIIEISLAKIENSKARKVNGKAGVLHRNLLVNSILNRVKTKEPLMNYRESQMIVDFDKDDYDMEKVPNIKERSAGQQRQTKQLSSKKQSSLVTKLNVYTDDGFSMQDTTTPLEKPVIRTCTEMKENKSTENSNVCKCSLKVPASVNCKSCNFKATTKKRLHSIESSEEDCPRKRLRCLWTPNVSTKNQDGSFSITSLSSQFGNLVADSETENKLVLRNKFVSAMVAC